MAALALLSVACAAGREAARPVVEPPRPEVVAAPQVDAGAPAVASPQCPDAGTPEVAGAADAGTPAALCAQEPLQLVEQGRAVEHDKGEDGADEAIALFQKALEQDPRCGEALWEMGWAYQLKGDPDSMVATLDRLKAIHPEYPGFPEAYETAVRRRDQAALLRSLPDPGRLPPPETEPSQGEPLTVNAVGDVHMGRAWPAERATLPPDDAAHLFDAVKESLRSADVTFGNLETVLADDGESQKCGKHPTKCFAFRVPTRYANALKDAGFDAMSIANNHAGDFGPKGRQDTMAALDKVGIGHSGPIGDIASLEVKGRKIALVAFSFGQDVYRIQDLETARRLVALLSKSHDLVFVSFHNGAEGKGAEHVRKGREKFLGEDRGDARAFAHMVIDAGADLVLGHGPHLLRAMELYRGRLITYSMGNFSSWDTFGLNHPMDLTGIFHVALAPNGVALSVSVEPVIISPPGTPIPDPERRAVGILRDLSQADFGSPFLDTEGAWKRGGGPQASSAGH